MISSSFIGMLPQTRPAGHHPSTAVEELKLQSELHRLKGKLLLNHVEDEAAGQCFRDAID
jgi:hypothetical protein